MSFWIELHCDLRRDGGNPKRTWEPGCHSKVNNNPAAMTRSNTRSSIDVARKYIERDAMSKGWILISGNQWACPFCATKLTPNDGELQNEVQSDG